MPSNTHTSCAGLTPTALAVYGDVNCMNMKETIANAGNTEVPCYLATKELGFEFSRLNAGEDNELWIAENSEGKFVASNHLELLGLIYMRTMRGSDWKASDTEIDDYLAQYYPKALEE